MANRYRRRTAALGVVGGLLLPLGAVATAPAKAGSTCTEQKWRIAGMSVSLGRACPVVDAVKECAQNPAECTGVDVKEHLGGS
jgi:hypothetical protein